MNIFLFISLVFSLFQSHFVNSAPCDPRLPHCADQKTTGNTANNCKSFWLIPGKASDSTKPTSKKLIGIDANSVVISPNPVKLPGCFTVSMKASLADAATPHSYLAKVEYSWTNLPQFSNLPCQNASANGCGGFGNNCVYCDICNSIQEMNKAKSNSEIVGQFKNMDCPQKAGTYQLTRQFCFNDLSELDKNHDCQFDFLQTNQGDNNYKDAIAKLQKVGYGTVVAKFTLARNATNEQEQSRATKETTIERATLAELAKKRQQGSWKVSDQEFQTYNKWYSQQRKDTWYKNEYLPWLLYYNEIASFVVSFDVCDKQPSPVTSAGSFYQYQCL